MLPLGRSPPGELQCPPSPADRDDRCFGRDRDRFRDSERFESDWRARPAASDSFDDYPPRRGDDSFGDSELAEKSRRSLRRRPEAAAAGTCAVTQDSGHRFAPPRHTDFLPDLVAASSVSVAQSQIYSFLSEQPLFCGFP